MFSIFLAFVACRTRSRRRIPSMSYIPEHRQKEKEKDVAPASNDYPIATCVESAGVNVRSGPSTNYGKISLIGYKQTVYITGQSNDWWQVNWQGATGYVKAEFFQIGGKVRADGGLNIRSGPGTGYSRVSGIADGATCTVIDCASGWYKVVYGGVTGWSSSDYITLVTSTTPVTPSGTVIRQTDSRFNSNIRNWGCAFMSLCWIGGVNSIDGCNSNYNRAIQNGWMRSDCYINSWANICPIANAKSYQYGSASYQCSSNQKEILFCTNSRTSSHFVVGNKAHGIEYDPAYDGSVAYSDCKSKRIYNY